MIILRVWSNPHLETLPDGASEEDRKYLQMRRRLYDRRQRMKKLPPTQKQLAYLQSLGYKGERPVTMAEASHLICQRTLR